MVETVSFVYFEFFEKMKSVILILCLSKLIWCTVGRGYIAYCPCMGRFGNQADHFLGALAFSKSLNRTLILPPWVEYRYGEPKSLQVPFDSYFFVDKLKEYNEVITMENFMKEVAPSIWTPDKRKSFCYTERNGEENNSCNAKNGNPFASFWDTFNIDFIGSEFYAPLNYDVYNENMIKKWKSKYPATNWPVLAFTGAPASFPVQRENVHLQKYVVWNDNISNKAKKFITENLSGGGFIGIHLRNGLDWNKACQHVNNSPSLFSSPQCTGYNNEKGSLTMSMCLPDKMDIIRQLKKTLNKVKDIKYIFVASDSNHMINDLNEALLVVKAVKLPSSDPHVDLAILGRSNYFIGNCVSSFTAFVKRERDVRGLPSEFWSMSVRKKIKHEEF